MGKLWRVDKALEDSEGLRWVREQRGAYDWAKVDWISVRRGRSEKYAFRGVCKSPSKGRGYRINCNVSRHTPYPVTQLMRVSPLYRNPDGTWPEVPEGHKVGDRYVATRDGKSVQWKRLYLPLNAQERRRGCGVLGGARGFPLPPQDQTGGRTARRDRSRRLRPEGIGAVPRGAEVRPPYLAKPSWGKSRSRLGAGTACPSAPPRPGNRIAVPSLPSPRRPVAYGRGRTV
jgi:hypothetical protein